MTMYCLNLYCITMFPVESLRGSSCCTTGGGHPIADVRLHAI